MKMAIKDKEKVVEELKRIVGEAHVSTAEADLYTYSQDMTENEPSQPDCIVIPDGVEEVQEVLRLANREKIPVIPFTGGDNVGGLTIPLRGGIILDLKRMNRVIEVNEEDRYIIVEPGFTFGDMKRLLDKEYPHLWYNFPASPPSVSIMANALLDGFGSDFNLGTNREGTNGLEVVLPTGEVVKVGSCAVSPFWFGRAPLPDLAGLFFSWQGATGVVTKIAVQLLPRPPFKQVTQIVITGIQPTCRFLRRIGRTRICDGCDSFPLDLAEVGKNRADFLEENIGKHPVVSLVESRTSGTFDRPPGPDEFVVTLRVAAESEAEMKAKMDLADVIINDELNETQHYVHPPMPFDYSAIPPRGTTDAMGGLTWVGSMGPTSQWEKGLERMLPIFDKYRFLRIVTLGCFRNSHFGMMRSVIGYNKGDPEEAARAKKCIREVLIATLDTGFVPYKASRAAVAEMMRRGDPNWVQFLKRVKRMLDPNNIMNPGRYGDASD
jgi:glycolate oxidase